MPPTILVVDDDPRTARLVEEQVALAGFRVVAVDGALEGAELAVARSPELVFISAEMPDGLLVCGHLKRHRDMSAPVVLVGGAPGRFGSQADFWVQRPLDPDALTEPMKAAFGDAWQPLGGGGGGGSRSMPPLKRPPTPLPDRRGSESRVNRGKRRPKATTDDFLGVPSPSRDSEEAASEFDETTFVDDPVGTVAKRLRRRAEAESPPQRGVEDEPTHADALSSLQAELEGLRDEVSKLGTALEVREERLGQLQQELEEAEEAQAELEEARADLELARDEAKARADELIAQLAQARQHASELKQELGAQKQVHEDLDGQLLEAKARTTQLEEERDGLARKLEEQLEVVRRTRRQHEAERLQNQKLRGRMSELSERLEEAKAGQGADVDALKGQLEQARQLADKRARELKAMARSLEDSWLEKKALEEAAQAAEERQHEAEEESERRQSELLKARRAQALAEKQLREARQALQDREGEGPAAPAEIRAALRKALDERDRQRQRARELTAELQRARDRLRRLDDAVSKGAVESEALQQIENLAQFQREHVQKRIRSWRVCEQDFSALIAGLMQMSSQIPEMHEGPVTVLALLQKLQETAQTASEILTEAEQFLAGRKDAVRRMLDERQS